MRTEFPVIGSFETRRISPKNGDFLFSVQHRNRKIRGRRVLLAGDHCQLPPTIISKEAAQAGLQVSLAERLLLLHGPALARLNTATSVQVGNNNQSTLTAPSRAGPSGWDRADPRRRLRRRRRLAAGGPPWRTASPRPR